MRYVSAGGACGDGRSAHEKCPVNQRFLPIWGENRCVFLFPQNGYGGIDLPRGIDLGEQVSYVLAKGYIFTKPVKSGIAFSLINWKCNAILL